MRVAFQSDRITLYQGHVLDVLREMPSDSVDCVICSPPYWGLRDYGLEPQIWDSAQVCEHEWGAPRIVATEVGGGNWAQGINGRGEEQPCVVDAKREPIRAEAVSRRAIGIELSEPYCELARKRIMQEVLL